jgi:hypothetical protein
LISSRFGRGAAAILAVFVNYKKQVDNQCCLLFNQLSPPPERAPEGGVIFQANDCTR